VLKNSHTKPSLRTQQKPVLLSVIWFPLRIQVANMPYRRVSLYSSYVAIRTFSNLFYSHSMAIGVLRYASNICTIIEALLSAKQALYLFDLHKACFF